jgi:hypothetical protein
VSGLAYDGRLVDASRSGGGREPGAEGVTRVEVGVVAGQGSASLDDLCDRTSRERLVGDVAVAVDGSE